ncbi:MAG: hypothetical protein HYY51_03700 [Candidatus Magasanikbacteria bacterium]|nr:hypothetical protein [Candidatus Magasanikbacteria bacterium]
MTLSTNKRWIIGIIVSLIVGFLGEKTYTYQKITTLNNQVTNLNAQLTETNNELTVCQNSQVNVGQMNVGDCTDGECENVYGAKFGN